MDLDSRAVLSANIPTRLNGNTTNILAAGVTEAARGHLTWMIALNRLTGFEVMTLDGPPRLVIDVSQR